MKSISLVCSALTISAMLTACGGGDSSSSLSTAADATSSPGNTDTSLSAQESAKSASGNADASPSAQASAKSAPQIVNQQALLDGAPYAGFIVTYRDGSAEKTNPTLAAAGLAKVQPVESRSVSASGASTAGELKQLRLTPEGASVVQSTLELKGADAVAMMKKLAALPNVQSVEPDLIGHAGMTPNDTEFPRQPNLWDMSLPQAWDYSTGKGVTVAVLDSGMNAHTDLSENVVPGFDFTRRNADVSDNAPCTRYHGMHVAGSIAAVGNNGLGVIGTGFGAKVMPVRVLGGDCSFKTSDLLDAITWASGGNVPGVTSLTAEAVPKVMNMSLVYFKSSTCSPALQSAIDGAVSRGVTLVVAAGNNSQPISMNNLANCKGVIPVASVGGPLNTLSSFSAYDKTQSVVAAPGENILSTVHPNSYRSMSGTSMAAAQVSGIVALIQSRRQALGLPLLPPAAVSLLLKNLGELKCGNSCQNGATEVLVRAHYSVEYAASYKVSFLRFRGAGFTHFYTTNPNDPLLLTRPFVSEGTVGLIDIMPATADSKPLYRFDNPSNGDHLYTANEMEQPANWVPMGVVGYCPPASASTKSLHRFYNRLTGQHFYSDVATEVATGGLRPWVYKGVACQVRPS